MKIAGLHHVALVNILIILLVGATIWFTHEPAALLGLTMLQPIGLHAVPTEPQFAEEAEDAVGQPIGFVHS